MTSSSSPSTPSLSTLTPKVSNLQTGEPVWYGLGRSQDTVRAFLQTLDEAQKKTLQRAAMDMFAAFAQAIATDPPLAHVAIVHDPFHLVKRAGEAVTEVRRPTFFRAGKERRAIGRGAHGLLRRAWEKTTEAQKQRLRSLFSYNATLARAYQLKEEFRLALKADVAEDVIAGVRHVLRRTRRRANVPLRRWHDSIELFFSRTALRTVERFSAAFRPPTPRPAARPRAPAAPPQRPAHRAPTPAVAPSKPTRATPPGRSSG